MHYKGSMKMEFVRKIVHIAVGVLIVLLFQARILDLYSFGLLILFYASVLLYNLRYEHEVLTRVLAINRADRAVPGLDILFYFVGCWLVLLVFPQSIACAAILILALADSIAHLVSRSFGATETFITKTTYLEGTIAGIVAGTLAGWVYVPFLAALVAATVAMVLEAGELRISDHHVDDNLVIPVAAAITLWIINLAFPFV
jgi:dolichol kinase